MPSRNRAGNACWCLVLRANYQAAAKAAPPSHVLPRDASTVVANDTRKQLPLSGSHPYAARIPESHELRDAGFESAHCTYVLKSAAGLWHTIVDYRLKRETVRF